MIQTPSRFGVILASTALLAMSPLGAAAGPGTMKAVRISSYGGPEVLHYEDVPKPVALPDEVLVRVQAAGVNPVDWKIRDGMLKGADLKMPFALGFDVAGIVESLGESVKDVAKTSKNIDHVKAAAVPLAALTAWQAMFDTAGLKSVLSGRQGRRLRRLDRGPAVA